MAAANPRVDAYIRNAPEFARPILVHLRKLVHEACPGAEETIKWSNPAFDYKGPFCGFAAFKQHVTKAAVKLNDDGVKAPPMRKGPRPELKAPADLLQALGRKRRIRTAVEWMAEGKVRNWKYVK